MTCLTLREPQSGAQARVLASFGFNCFEFQVPHAGRPLDVLWSVPGFASGGERPSHSGIPILFPFPGRIAGTVFHWQGRDYDLEANDGRGNAIHGFVLSRPWRVIEQSESQATGQFQASVDDASLLERWPGDFRLTVTYQLVETSLRCILRVENPGETPLPFGLGTHPYFALPLGGGDAGACRIRLPVTRRWELDEMIPTGQVVPVADADDYQRGLPFSQLKHDDVFSGLLSERGRCRAEIEDPESGVRLFLSFDDLFRECVVYTPPHREAICIEPYTCVPGAYHLPMDHGLRSLGPGGRFEATLELAVQGCAAE